MDCNYTTIKTCELKGSTFRCRLVDFGDFDISDYSFSVGFVSAFGPLTSIQDRSGRIRTEVWMESEGDKKHFE